jgi:hypothetical protein
MAKEDLLREAAKLRIEGLDDTFTNKQIQRAIDEAPRASESPQTVEDAPEAPVEEQVVEVVEESPVAQETAFTLAQLKPHSVRLFGYGYHVIVGAVSAGCIPSGKVTRTQVRNGIDRYLKMPIESKEG